MDTSEIQRQINWYIEDVRVKTQRRDEKKRERDDAEREFNRLDDEVKESQRQLEAYERDLRNATSSQGSR